MLADSSYLRLVLAAAVLLAAGCGEPEIQSYTVPRITSTAKATTPKTVASATGEPQQMLGGILLAGKSAWFFKVMDDPAVVEPLEPAFKKWVESVRIGAGDNPTWELPTGWEAQPGDAIRFAKIRMGTAADAPELTITRLDQAGERDNYLLLNFNRWRSDQLGLPKWSVEEMHAQIEHLKAGDHAVEYVNLKGTAKAGGMSPPFANRPPMRPEPPQREPGNHSLDFVKPTGWEQVTPSSAFQQLAFRAKADDELLNITVTQLGKESGSLFDNINRWRMQLQLGPIDPKELDAATKSITAGLGEGKWIEITDTSEPQRAIFGAVITSVDSTWYVKAVGPAKLATQERANLLDFIRHLKTSR